MKRRASILTLVVALAPTVALASTPQTFAGLANQIVQLLGSATTDLIVFAIVVYFWGVSSSLFKQGEEARGLLRRQLLWGVFVIFLAVTIWGIVQLLQSSFFGASVNGTTSSTGTTQNCTSLNCSFGTQ